MEIYELIDTLMGYQQNSLTINLSSLIETLKNIKKEHSGFFYVVEKNSINIIVSVSLYESYSYLFEYTYVYKDNRNVTINSVNIIKDTLF